jgi:hypothetical protein
MKVYVAGSITGNSNYKEQFNKAEETLKREGHIVLNPSVLPSGFTNEEYMTVCIPMLTMCEAIYLLNGWERSGGANIEKRYADYSGKLIVYEGENVTEKADLSLGIC